MRITRIERSAAQALPGVIAVVDGAEIAAICKPWVATLAHLAGIKSAPQYPLALERAPGRASRWWRSSPRRAPAPKTRSACSRSSGKTLPAVLDTETALDPATPLIHPELGDNLCFTRIAGHRRRRRGLRAARRGGVRGDLRLRPPHRRDAGAALPDRRLEPGRPAAHRLPLVPGPAHDAGPVLPPVRACRSARCAWSAATSAARFGIKVHAYPDDFATVALAMLLQPAGEVRRRPAGELRQRHPRARAPHPGAHRGDEGRRDPRLRDRRPDRHRPVSACSRAPAASRATRSST